MSTRIQRNDGWGLPDILGIDATHVRYLTPKLHYVGERIVESREAIEFLVRTSREFPARAWSPAIFVGDAPVVKYETIGENLYRFFAFDFRALVVGAPIFVGWPQFPERKVRTRFFYQPRDAAQTASRPEEPMA